MPIQSSSAYKSPLTTHTAVRYGWALSKRSIYETRSQRPSSMPAKECAGEPSP